MINSTSETTVARVVCAECEDIKEILLDRTLFDERGRQGEVQIFCGVREKRTCWSGVETDRRSGFDRRSAPQARLGLPISIRCSPSTLQFTELTTTLTSSRKGASFFSRHPLREGMALAVVLPFREDDTGLAEFPARVVWVQEQGDGRVAGVELRGERPGNNWGVTPS